SPWRRHSAKRSSISDQSNTIFSSEASEAAGRMRERSSAADTQAVPGLPTTTAAAALAARMAGSEPARLASHAESTANTLSPSPRPTAPPDRMGRPARRGPAPHPQRHPMLAARDQHRLALDRAGEIRGRGGHLVVRDAGAAGRLGEFLAVRRDEGGAAVDRKI